MDALTAHLGPARVHNYCTAAGLRPGVRSHGVFPSFRVRECMCPYAGSRQTIAFPFVEQLSMNWLGGPIDMTREGIEHQLAGLQAGRLHHSATARLRLTSDLPENALDEKNLKF